MTFFASRRPARRHASATGPVSSARLHAGPPAPATHSGASVASTNRTSLAAPASTSTVGPLTTQSLVPGFQVVVAGGQVAEAEPPLAVAHGKERALADHHLSVHPGVVIAAEAQDVAVPSGPQLDAAGPGHLGT
jgi:hypothetical protein